MTDKLRKYVLPSIPYVFIGWVFLKLGTAYRLAAGGNFAHKLLGLGQTVGAAFADFAPGLAPFDWLVGIVGAAAFRLLIYFKSKNAKKFRRDAEYGTARWGCFFTCSSACRSCSRIGVCRDLARFSSKREYSAKQPVMASACRALNRSRYFSSPTRRMA